MKSDRPSFSLETLPSPVIVDMRDDVVVDSVGALESGDLRKSIVEELGSGSRELRTETEESETEEEPRRNRAWPVRLRREMNRLNLETVKSVT